MHTCIICSVHVHTMVMLYRLFYTYIFCFLCCGSKYRPYAVDVRRFHIPDIFRIMSGKRMVASVALDRKRALAIMCRQYVVQFQFWTTKLYQLSACSRDRERMQQVIDATTLYCTVSCHSKYRMYCLFLCIIM